MSSLSFPDLAGRRAVVTGAAQGIGRAIARRLLDAGVEVVVVDRDGSRLEESYTESSEGGRCHLVDGDIREGAAIADRVIDAAGGPVDLIVNNVGIATEHGFLDLKEDDFDEVLGTNLRGPFFFTQQLVRELRVQRLDTIRGAGLIGSILFISSVHEWIPSRRLHYDMTKAAIGAVVRNLAIELGRDGIRVNAISPGWIRTNPDPTSPEQVKKERRMLRRIPLGRAGVPDDVAKLALHLLSDEATGYMTGEILGLHGALAPGTWMREP